MANSISLTQFLSKTAGTVLETNSSFINLSYNGIDEWQRAREMGYGIDDTVNIKVYGYPDVQLGLSTTSQDITDLVIPYTMTDNDIYNVTRNFDIRTLGLQVVGGQAALVGNPFKDPNDPKLLNPQARALIDNYSYPAGVSLNSKLEATIAEKIRTAAFYTPIDRPSKLGTINTFADVNQVTTMMNNLGFMGAGSKVRCGVMNNDDAGEVADSLQNMFNEGINDNITKNARLGGPDKGRLAGLEIFTSNVIATTPVSPQYSAAPTATLTIGAVGAGGTTLTIAGVISTTGTVFNAGTLLAIPSVNLINQTNKLAQSKTLVVCVAADAVGDGAGNATITLSQPLVATGEQAWVDSLPAVSAPVELFPGQKNNYFFVPMGIIANPLPMGEIIGASNGKWTSPNKRFSLQTYVQGLVPNGTNTYRISMLCPTLAIPRYIINLPSAL